MSARRITADDLEHAAEWMDAYEADDRDGARDHREGPYTGDDDVAAKFYAVADWMRSEADRRRAAAAEAALIRDVQRNVAAKQNGRRPSAAAVRKVLAAQRAAATTTEGN